MNETARIARLEERTEFHEDILHEIKQDAKEMKEDIREIARNVSQMNVRFSEQDGAAKALKYVARGGWAILGGILTWFGVKHG